MTFKEILLELGEELFADFTPNLVTHKFIYFCKKAGLVGFKLYSIRHTHATKLICFYFDIPEESMSRGGRKWFPYNFFWKLFLHSLGRIDFFDFSFY